jgi:hypothetical protein
MTVVFVILAQIKINVTNAYAGSLAWSNFFARVTHSHPGRVVWLVFNVVHRHAADAAGRVRRHREGAGRLQQRGDRLGRRAGGRPHHQQAAGPEPQGHRVPARLPVRLQPRGHGFHDHRGAGGQPGLRGRDGRSRGGLLALHRARPGAAALAPARLGHPGQLLPGAHALGRLDTGRGGALLGVREPVRIGRHGQLPGLPGADLLAVLLARVALPRPLQDQLARHRPGARLRSPPCCRRA